MKKFLFNILMTTSLLTAFCVSAFARTAYRLPAEDGGDGTVTVKMLDTDGEPITSGELSVYKVAGMDSDNEKFLYVVEDDFRLFTDEISGENFAKYLLNMDNDFELEHNAYFAESLKKYVKDNSVTPYQAVKVDEEGKAEFTHLRNGLYLVVQTVNSKGYNEMSAFLVSVPKCVVDTDGKEWYYYEIDAQPKTQPLKKLPPPPPTVPELPNTGLPWMQVAVMAISGMALFLIGFAKHKKAGADE